MPQFILNRPPLRPGFYTRKSGQIAPRKPHPFYYLSTFAKGYVEAMFFTNGDTGDDRENLLNEWGVEKLTRKAVKRIAADCAKFEADAAELLALAYTTGDYDDEQAGRDFWFTRQGHGVGFWDRAPLDRTVCSAGGAAYSFDGGDTVAGNLGRLLSAAAKTFGECNVEAYRGWIHVH